MEGQTGHQIEVWSAKPVKRYTIETKWREVKFGKGQRSKERWTTVDTTKHTKLKSPARWDIPGCTNVSTRWPCFLEHTVECKKCQGYPIFEKEKK